LRSDLQPEITGSAGQFEPLRWTVVGAEGKEDGRLRAEYIERYHYLGHRVPVGATLRYWVRSGHCGDRVLACPQWSSPTWKMAARLALKVACALSYDIRRNRAAVRPLPPV
jgi:hypothetical protein